ncbi:DUF3429 domain-containing protein [Hyphobacterium sp.]|uniref:DUF3429 domain-containing protein n=1 Tax=Hyphobacterium sp. TaxID=2004662 RepID=UPI003BAB2C5E
MSQRPILPYVLGIAGLIPFVFLGGTILFANIMCDPYEGRRYFSVPGGLAPFLIGYAVVILSFLGGTRWGAEIQRAPQKPDAAILCLSMLPPLIGWATLPITMIQLRLDYILFTLACALLVQGAWDVFAVRKGRLPSWYANLRIILTLVAVISLLVPGHVHLIINDFVYCAARR